MSDISKDLRRLLEEQCYLSQPKLVAQRQSADGSERYTLELGDGLLIESVYIPEEDHATLCLSSQVGCAQGCRFCLTARQGFSRNLTVSEILNQIFLARSLTARKKPITNLVFMGMGEPFMNYPRTIQASKILADPEGLAIANKKITISTSGIVPKIIQYTDEAHPFSLAISLHAPEQELREKIMPIAKKFPLDQLIDSIRYYMRAKKTKPGDI